MGGIALGGRGTLDSHDFSRGKKTGETLWPFKSSWPTTPWKIKMLNSYTLMKISIEPEKHAFENENHLPNLHFFGFHVAFRECIEIYSTYSYQQTVQTLGHSFSKMGMDRCTALWLRVTALYRLTLRWMWTKATTNAKHQQDATSGKLVISHLDWWLQGWWWVKKLHKCESGPTTTHPIEPQLPCTWNPSDFIWLHE